MNYPEFVAALAKPLPTREERIKHAFLGLIGELGELTDAWKKHSIYGKELDHNNVIEELGDFRFYLQMLENEDMDLGYYQYPWKVKSDFETLLFEASIRIGHLVNLYLSDSRNLEIVNALANVISTWKSMCATTTLTPQEIININIEKLSKRYPNISYSNEHAIARLDKNEEKDHVRPESE